AYVKQCVEDGTLGHPVSALVSRHVTRSLGAKIAGRSDLGPVQMEGTHDIDLCAWWMEPARPKRVYAQAVDGVMRKEFGLPDCVALDQSVLVTPEQARRVMEVTLAADLSAQRGQPVDLPLPRD